MKEGSFGNQIAGLDFTGDREIEDFELVKHTPTPDQTPARLNLSDVPESVMRSNVMESLINQNDDLMARLTVSIRRIGILEEKISDSQTKELQYKTKYENLKDQILILKEQSRLLAERAKKAELRNSQEEQGFNSLKEQIKVLEIRYAELATTNQEKLRREQNRTESISLKMRRLQKYRKNIQLAIRATVIELKDLKKKYVQADNTNNELKKTLSQTTQYVTEQAKEHKSQIQQLTSSFENQIKEQQLENEMLLQQNRMLGEQVREGEKLYTDKVAVENELIIAKRRFEELEIGAHTEISNIQKTVSRYRNEANDLALKLEEQKAVSRDHAETVGELTTENSRLSEQVETLQLLWREQQNSVEKLNEQKNSLQKLNQELSMAVNQYRRDIRNLKEQNESLESNLKSATEKTARIIKEKISLAENDQENGIDIDREDKITPEIISRIDKALAQLPSDQ